MFLRNWNFNSGTKFYTKQQIEKKKMLEIKFYDTINRAFSEI